MAEYIEKKKLVNSLKMWLMDLENDMNKGDYGELCENKGAREAVESCICEVEEQPAADVQPVKQGHWIEEVREIGETFRLYQTYIHCSECGKEHYSGTLPKPNFCDACGARMIKDGEQNENN